MKLQKEILSVSFLLLLTGCSNNPVAPIETVDFSGELNSLMELPKPTDSFERKTENIPKEPNTVFWPTKPKYLFVKETFEQAISGETIETKSGKRYKLLSIDTDGSSQKEKRKYVNINDTVAKTYLNSTLINQSIYIEVPPTIDKSQKEVPAYIWIGNSEQLQNLNALMVKQGVALSHRNPVSSVYDKELKDMENKAREEKKGIWNGL